MTDAQITTPASLAERYSFIQVIGEGSQATTYLANELGTSSQVAIKRIRFYKIANLKSYELFQREASVLKKLHVSGVPKF